MKAVHVVVTGRVQGVAFRAWTQRTALSFGLDGWVRNRTDGSVEAMFAGPEHIVDSMVEKCRKGPPAARVATVQVQPSSEDSVPSGFDIR